ncbi:MAG TPA: AAA family ATPase [Terracidiphilus sp.]|jgi:general secretion pathway protein A
MLVRYFGFKEEPFGISPDPRCLFLSRTHREALEALEDGFSSNRGFSAMIAPPGMGKTTLLFRFLEDVRESARVVFLFDLDATCEPRDFVAYVLRDLGITPASSSAEMHDQLGQALIKENMAGRKFVIVIDEAQNLSDAVLERVRLLTNFENSRGKLIQVVLSGQPQLSEKLLQSSLVQLRQRISTVCHIEPLSAQEIAGYIDYRVKMAGYLGQAPFSEDAIRMIADASQGTPRIVNNLCFNALSLCCKLKSIQVDAAMVAKVIAALQLTPPSRAVTAAAVEVPVAAAMTRAAFDRAEADRAEVDREPVRQSAAEPRRRKEFAGLRLIPDLVPDNIHGSIPDPLPVASDSVRPYARRSPKTADLPARPRFWERTRLRLVQFASATAGNVMLWVPAAALILAISFVGVLRITEVLSPASHASGPDQTTDVTAPPSPDDDPDATESTSPSGNQIPAAAPRPMQATSVPKPSPIAAAPATSINTHSADPQKSMQGRDTVPAPSAAAQPVAMAPQANAQPPSNNSAAPPQPPAAPVASAPKQVHAALAGDAPQPVPAGATAPNVRPALPQP